MVGSGCLAVVAVGSWFGYSYYLRQSTEPVTVSLIPVQKGDVEITVSESGIIELGGQQTLKSPGENATVEQVKVTEGEKVRAGETNIEVQTINHLGIIAGIIDEIVIVEIINEQLGIKPQEKLNSGMRTETSSAHSPSPRPRCFTISN